MVSVKYRQTVHITMTAPEQKVPLAVEWKDDHIVMLDQRMLPHDFVFENIHSVDKLAASITDMVVRGAPAIGIAAAYGMALAYVNGVDMDKAKEKLEASRPTAKDLFTAVDRIADVWTSGKDPVAAAIDYASEIEEACRTIGETGAELISKDMKILTHCNAGALATVYWGTALAPIRFAHYHGKKPYVFVDETRPRYQGARLTAWELRMEGIPNAIIVDNAAGHFMSRGEVDMVITGADRIAMNGDAANKIGTYEKAVVAHENGIPFYIAAPATTFDPTAESGDAIPIEERSQDEVLEWGGLRVGPEGAVARNPAFDVTPARYITGFITEKGVLKADEIKGVFGD